MVYDAQDAHRIIQEIESLRMTHKDLKRQLEEAWVRNSDEMECAMIELQIQTVASAMENMKKEIEDNDR